MTHFFEFWDPLIAPGRMKLETSYWAQRWIAVSTNEKMQNLSKEVTWGLRDPLFGILEPPNISGMVKARNVKFGTEMDCSKY